MKPFKIRVVSFGFKKSSPPLANMLFDVRFLKNPYWVDELRPLSGLDKPVRDYVMEQSAAQEFLSHVLHMAELVMPPIFEAKSNVFTFAFGCTGGQHRSVSVAEVLAESLRELFPDHEIEIEHREMSEVLSQGPSTLGGGA